MLILVIMLIVRNSSDYTYFGLNSRAFLRHIGLFHELPVGALTVSILGLYTDIWAYMRTIMGTGYWLALSWAYLTVMGQVPTSSTRQDQYEYRCMVSLFKTVYVMVPWNSCRCSCGLRVF
jgi:hypothetical protein